jgi:hypothetical protein
LNKKQKEEKVIELYKQGKTVREIAKIVHMSFGDICSIIKKFTDNETGKNIEKNNEISPETHAIKLFSKGRTPIEVKIALNMQTEEVERYYKDYWKLKGLHELCRYYETEIKKDLHSFLKLYKNVRSLGIQDYEIVHVLSNITKLSYFDSDLKTKEKEIKILSIKKENIISELDDLDASIEESQIHRDQLIHEIQDLSSKINIKKTISRVLEESLDDLLSSEDYSKVKNLILQTASSILDSRKDVLIASVVTVIQAIKVDPNKEFLIRYVENNLIDNNDVEFDNLNNSDYHLYVKKMIDYLATYHQTLVDLSDMLYDRILDIIQNQILYPIGSQEQYRNY